MTQLNDFPEVINVERPETWPKPLADFVNMHHQLFRDWEIGNVSPQRYEYALHTLGDILCGYAIRGWHCTRLTNAESEAIRIGGMQLPDENMLARRIDALVVSGCITPVVAAALKSKNLAHEENRHDVWFCFYAPSREDEGGIGDFFRYWGGEALYKPHKRDPQMAAVIEKIGTPCLIEADVPISLLKEEGLRAASKIIARFLVSRGDKTTEPLGHNDRIVHPLPAAAVRRVIRHPTTAFRELTGCDAWRNPI
jgi:hypothetical protein